MSRIPPRPLLLLALLLASTAAWAATPTQSEAAQPLVWRGDISTAHSLMQGLAEAWHDAGHPAIELQPFSTLSGIDAALAGKADFAGSVRAAFPERSQEADLNFIPVAWDALVMVVNPDNPVRHISLAQLHDIYLGKITNWKAIGGPDHRIHLYSVATPLDGVEFSLRKYLFRHGDQPVASRRLYLNTEQLENGVALDPWGLGATTLSNVHGNDDLATLTVQGVRPSVAHIKDGSYPLYQPLFLVVPAASAKLPRIAEFLRFVNSETGQSVLAAQHLVPWDDTTLMAMRLDKHRLAVQNMSAPRITGPMAAAPGATYAFKAANAPTSKRTLEARARLADKRARAAASAKARAANEKATAQSESD